MKLEWVLENDKWWGYGKWIVVTHDFTYWTVMAAGPSVALARCETLDEGKALVESLQRILSGAAEEGEAK